MLGKENIEKQVADNQEDRLSSGELQCGQSQQSPGVTRPPSISSDDTRYSEPNDTDDSISNEVTEKATLFVKTFVKKCEERISECFEEVEPGSKIKKAGKIADKCTSIVNDSTPSGLLKSALKETSECIGSFAAKKHKEREKKFYATVVPFKDQQREILVRAGLEIFQKFERQFVRVVDVDESLWERGIKKLAVDAASRAKDYISSSNEEEGFSVDLITRDVVLGKSKRETAAKSLHLRSAGYKVKDRQSGETWLTSELYGNTGIKKMEDGTTKYYVKRGSNSKEFSYRLPFAWELEKWRNESIDKEYTLVITPEEQYVYILDNGKKEELARFILKKINELDSLKKKDIESVKEHLRKQNEDRCQFSYDFGKIAEFFIERKAVIKELNLKLHGSSQELEMSRVVLISGKPGTGKSELARGYGFNEKRKGTFIKIIWIDASSHNDLLTSFSKLARRLGIPVQDRGIESIIKDIYEHYQNTKSFFVFDNVNGYKEIEKFLPSHFFDVFSDREKPFILITSYKEGWGDKRIKEIKLNNFDPGESDKFLRKALERDESQDYISKLGKALNYHPLSLAEAAVDINKRGTNISEYLKCYYGKIQESNLDRLVELVISEEGQRLYDILAFIAYLSRGQKTASDALNLLDKVSVIELEKSIAKIHEGTQKTIIEEELTGTTEGTLRKIMTSLMDSDTTSVTYIISVWSYASKYKELVNEFINSTYNGSTILHLLAQDGNEEVIRLILEKIDQDKLSKAVNNTNKIGLAPVHYAISYDRLGVVKYLMEKGANLIISECGINYAAAYGALEVMKYFINEKYFTLDKWNEQGKIPLGYAIRYGQLRMVKYLIEKGADVNLLDTEEQLYLFYYAFLPGNLDIAQCLVRKLGGLNLLINGDKSLLHHAAIHGNLDVVKCLVEKEDDVDLRDKDGMSPLHYASIGGNLDIVKCFVEKEADVNLGEKSGKNTLHYAVMNGNLDIVEYLVGNDVNIDLQDEDGMSPLHYATIQDNLDIVKYLVENDADVNLQNESSMSPLHYASIGGNLDIAKCLVENVADVDLDDASDRSPLHHAAMQDNLDIVKYLVENDADVNLQDEDGMSPLHYAAMQDNLDIVKYLVENDADVNLQDEDGMSPLHYAAMQDNLDIVKYLVENDADVNLQDEDGMSPLRHASIDGNLDIVKCLVENGADIDLDDASNKSPLHYAFINNNLDIVQYLIQRGDNGVVTSYLSSVYIQSLREGNVQESVSSKKKVIN
ncbi:MAG: ankyrin repeat domain-containing protein [Wolbachia endosymbiont of Armadillidium vulgare]